MCKSLGFQKVIFVLLRKKVFFVGTILMCINFLFKFFSLMATFSLFLFIWQKITNVSLNLKRKIVALVQTYKIICCFLILCKIN